MLSASFLRAAALVFASALALHELRYLIGGRPTGDAFQADHGYLPLAAIAASALLLLAAIALVRAVARAHRTGRTDEQPRSDVRVWALAFGALIALHVGQEVLESALSGAGTTAMAANGAVLVVPLAALFGGLVALAARGASHALAGAARSAHFRGDRGAVPAAARPRPVRGRAPISPLALHLAERAPPLLA